MSNNTFRDCDDRIKELWREHLAAPFPKNFLGKPIGNVGDIQLVSLEADIAGSVAYFLDHGTLDVWRASVLGLSYRNCDYIQESLYGDGQKYFWRLGLLAGLVLRAVASVERPSE